MASCSVPISIDNSNQLADNSISKIEINLSKEIIVFIGRGGCCSGHLILVNKGGEIKYLVAVYTIPQSNSEMPEMYDSQMIIQNSNYKPKQSKLSEEKTKRLNELIANEQKLHFNDEVAVKDDFYYSIYVGDEKVASVHESHGTKVPGNLAELIDLICGEVEFYKLPGMA